MIWLGIAAFVLVIIAALLESAATSAKDTGARGGPTNNQIQLVHRQKWPSIVPTCPNWSAYPREQPLEGWAKWKAILGFLWGLRRPKTMWEMYILLRDVRL